MAYNNETPYFKVLTPRDDIDVSKSHKDALDTVIQNKDVKNVAFTGSYGSGKSSILHSYFKNTKSHWCTKVRWLLSFFDDNINRNAHFVSLVSFNNDNKKNQDIEQSLLQQLFYSLDANRSKYSHIKRIIHPKKIISLLKIILVSISILVPYLYFTTYDEINKFSPNLSSLLIVIKGQIGKNYNIVLSHVVLYISVIIAFMISAMIAYLYSKRFNFKKLDLGALSAEGNKNDSNPLNHYLDELIYFFRRHKNYNIFVFEDMDRFDNPNIFVKLREINKAVNDYFLFNTTYCHPRVIKFIYVLRDDVFNKPEERTKFFDAIISVVPFISYGESAYGKFKDVFNIKNDIKNDITDDITDDSLQLINEISFYINDYRLMLAIYNDYNIYKDVLGLHDDNSNQVKLLAMMIYKNCYPRDFDELHYNKGLLYEVLGKYAIKYELDACKKELELIKVELPIEYKELRDLIINWLINKNINTIGTKNIEQYSLDELSEYMNPIYDESNLKSSIFDKYVKYSNKNIRVLPLENEKMRLQNAEAGLYYPQSKSSILATKFMMMHRYRAMRFENSDNKILEFLLSNGYIGDDYYFYIDMFVQGDFTINDRNFLHEAEYTYNKQDLYNMPINNLRLVFNHLYKHNFVEEVQNVHVLRYLLDEKYEDKLLLYKDMDFRKYFLKHSSIQHKHQLAEFIIKNNMLEPNWADIGLLITNSIYYERVENLDESFPRSYHQFSYGQDIPCFRDYLKDHTDEILKSENNANNTYYKLIVMNYIRLNNEIDNDTYSAFVNSNPGTAINHYLNKDKMCITLDSHKSWVEGIVKEYYRSITIEDLIDKIDRKTNKIILDSNIVVNFVCSKLNGSKLNYFKPEVVAQAQFIKQSRNSL